VSILPSESWDDETPMAMLYTEVTARRPQTLTRWVDGPPKSRLAATENTVVTFVSPHDGQHDVVDAIRGWLRAQQDRGPEGQPLADLVSVDGLIAFSRGATLPPFDLVVRSRGQRPLCGSLLLLATHTELYALPGRWEELHEDDVDAALAAFAVRDRRFGR